MPVNLDKAKLAVATHKLALVCAMCERYWEAKDAGAPGCGQSLCGGPLVGRTFPLYRGMMSGGIFAVTCFACGADATHNISVEGAHGPLARTLGACDAHKAMVVRRYSAQPLQEGTTPLPALIVASADGTARLEPHAAAPTSRPKYRLSEVIAENERDEQRKREWF
jgi:hypothetical protein